jgi:hypothetical protein
MDQHMASTEKQMLGNCPRALAKGFKNTICGLSANDIEHFCQRRRLFPIETHSLTWSRLEAVLDGILLSSDRRLSPLRVLILSDD